MCVECSAAKPRAYLAPIGPFRSKHEAGQCLHMYIRYTEFHTFATQQHWATKEKKCVLASAINGAGSVPALRVGDLARNLSLA